MARDGRERGCELNINIDACVWSFVSHRRVWCARGRGDSVETMSHDHRSALRGVDENVGGGAPRGVNGKMTTPSSSSMRAEATTTTK